MAIQHRRGAYGDFNASKMKAGEIAVVLSGDSAVSDGKTVYVAFAASDVKRLAFASELTPQNTATVAGYVTAPGANVSGKVWKTGPDGTPAWRDETSVDTGEVTIDTSASAGTTDGDLYALLSSLGWASDVISS